MRLPSRRGAAELLLLALLLAAALAMRLQELDEPVDNYDEGVYLESLFLIAEGQRPVADVPISQGPLYLQSQLPFFLLFDQDVAAGRAGAVAFSLIGLVGVWWIGRQLGGPWAGLAAAGLLAASPTYLRFSRQVMADLPAVVPTILAVGVALRHRRSGRRTWLVGSALLLALGLLIKPLAAPAGVGVAALVWRNDRRGWRDLGLLLGIVLLAGGLVLAALGPRAVIDQTLGFREEAREAYGWSPARNWELLVDKLDQEQASFYVLALVGAAGSLLGAGRRAAIGVALWASAGLALLLATSPLRYHYMVLLLPPLAILGGRAVGHLAGAVRGGPTARALGAAGLAALLVYGGSLPELARRDRLLLENVDAAGAGSDDFGDELEAVERIRRLSERDDLVLTDNPYLAFLARRRVPAALIDPSETRLRSGDLTPDEVIGLGRASRPELIVLWEGTLSRVPGFLDWAERDYEVARRFGTVDGDQPRAILKDRDP